MGSRITQKTVSALHAPVDGSRIHYDGEIPGFGVRITAAGVVSFILNYRIHGRERRYTIGRYPELTATAARQRAGTLRVGIGDGKDPLEVREKAPSEPTVAELGARYLEWAAKKKRPSSARNDRQMIKNNIGPKLGTLRLKAVGRRDIEALHSSLKATPYQANRVLALLSKMLELAKEWNLFDGDNPARGIPRFQEDPRERWLSAAELSALNKALDAHPDKTVAAAIRLLVLTGAREGEVLNATWDQFDLRRAVWTKPSHHTKQKKIEHIPLSEQAISLLRGLKRAPEPIAPLFPGKKGGAHLAIRNSWILVCKAAGLVVEAPGKRGRGLRRYRPTLRIHDLRHTYASHLVSKGVSLHVVGKLLGHTQPQTTARYAHIADKALRDATNQFGKTFKAASGRK